MFEVTDHEGVLHLVWSHGKAHVLDLEFLEGLADQLQQLAERQPRALLLTGAGRIFSAGVDLFRIVEEGRPYIEKFLPALDVVLERLAFFPAPVVAALNGHAIAGGYLLASAADFRLAAEGKGSFGVPEVAVGVPFPAWGAELLRFVVPAPHFSRMITEGTLYPVARALDMGLVDEVCAPENLIERAQAWALRQGSFLATATTPTKELLRAPIRERAQAALERQGSSHVEIWSRSETLDHIREYLAKTVGKAKS